MGNFVKLLKSFMNKDPLETMDVSYQADLEKDVAAEVKNMRSQIPAGVADAMRDFADQYLVETYIGKDTPLLDTLREMPGMPEDSEAALSKLPAGLLMKHFAAVYK